MNGRLMMAVAMTIWGALNAAIPVSWSAWLAQGISDEPESGGGLLVAAIQLSIMLGAALGGLLLDHLSIAATLIGGAVLLAIASLTIGNGDRIKPVPVNASVTPSLDEIASASRCHCLRAHGAC